MLPCFRVHHVQQIFLVYIYRDLFYDSEVTNKQSICIPFGEADPDQRKSVETDPDKQASNLKTNLCSFSQEKKALCEFSPWRKSNPRKDGWKTPSRDRKIDLSGLLPMREIRGKSDGVGAH